MPKTAGAGQARTLEPAELDQLLAAAPSPAWRACFAIQRFTGSRISETLALQWGAIHTDRITFRSSTTKTRSTREPLVSDSLRRELVAYRQHWAQERGHQPRATDLLFPGRNPREPLTRAAADAALKRALLAVGSNFPSGVSTHSLRRSLGRLQTYIDVAESEERAALALIDN